MSTLAKVICKVNAISINIPMVFFIELEQTILRFLWNHKRPPKVKAILKKMSKTRGITLFDFKLYFKDIVIINNMVLA